METLWNGAKYTQASHKNLKLTNSMHILKNSLIQDTEFLCYDKKPNRKPRFFGFYVFHLLFYHGMHFELHRPP
jgi:hypothetical protein